MFDRILNSIPNAVHRTANVVGLIAGGVAAARGAFATGVTIPDSGVDMPGYIAAAGLALGTIVTAAIGVYFAYWGIKEGLKWMRKV